MPETRMGGSQEEFPETVWSSVINRPDAPERREKLDLLLSRYWRPVYKYIRAAWRKPIEDAKDLTQEFFLGIMDGGIFERYDSDKGRFRSFLKGALKNFLSRDHRDGKTLKRGGGKKVFSLDVENFDAGDVLAESRQYSPEEIFDRQWAQDVLKEGLTKLELSLKEEGKELYFRIYQKYALAKGERPTYTEIAKELKMSVRDVENRLRFARSRLNDLIVQNISDYVTSREAVIQELKELF